VDATVGSCGILSVDTIGWTYMTNEHSARLPVDGSVKRYQNANLLELLNHVLSAAAHIVNLLEIRLASGVQNIAIGRLN